MTPQEYKKNLFSYIDYLSDKLPVEDVQSHIELTKFKKLVEAFDKLYYDSEGEAETDLYGIYYGK